jgi:hypothetical protein
MRRLSDCKRSSRSTVGPRARRSRSLSGDPGSWASVVSAGNGNTENYQINTFEVFNGVLYAAGERLGGAEVWRTPTGNINSWEVVVETGFGNPNNEWIGSLIEFNGLLYASTQNWESGAEIFSSPDGTTWSKVIGGGIDDPTNHKIESLFIFNDQLYVVSSNYISGLKVWRTEDGETFEVLIDDGFGDSNNFGSLWNSATINYNDHLFIGTFNDASGGELWRYDIKSGSGFDIYLPLILK